MATLLTHTAHFRVHAPGSYEKPHADGKLKTSANKLFTNEPGRRKSGGGEATAFSRAPGAFAYHPKMG